jgi:uncharacterized protein (UPF0333 family)
MTSWIRSRRSARGQAMVEFSLVLPFMLLVVLGVVEVSYVLLDQHIVTRLAREGSNLISRDVSLQDAANALKNMSTRPVNLTDGTSKVIFSVLKKVETTGVANFDKQILYQRYEYGSLSASSKITIAGSGSFGSGPEYVANNSNGDTGLQVTSLPPNMMATGGLLYVTEIFTKHPLITPFDKFGAKVPEILYSIAYF